MTAAALGPGDGCCCWPADSGCDSEREEMSYVRETLQRVSEVIVARKVDLSRGEIKFKCDHCDFIFPAE